MNSSPIQLPNGFVMNFDVCRSQKMQWYAFGGGMLIGSIIGYGLWYCRSNPVLTQADPLPQAIVEIHIHFRPGIPVIEPNHESDNIKCVKKTRTVGVPLDGAYDMFDLDTHNRAFSRESSQQSINTRFI